MTASHQRKKNRKRIFETRRDEKIKKLREGNKQVSRKKVDGKLVKTTSYYGGNKLHNIPKEGQRNLVLKAGGHGMGSDYKSSEKKAFKEAEKWQKSKEKKKITEERKNKGNKLKINKDKKSNGGSSSSSSSGSSKWIRTRKGTLAKRGSIAARDAERRERARKRAQEAANKRLANK